MCTVDVFLIISGMSELEPLLRCENTVELPFEMPLEKFDGNIDLVGEIDPSRICRINEVWSAVFDCLVVPRKT